MVVLYFFKIHFVWLSQNPQLLCEYKPRINTSSTWVDSGHFVEMLVQGYYCLKSHGTLHECLHCLTDLRTWHYYRLTMNGSHFGVEYIKNSPNVDFKATSQELQEHFEYIVPVIINLP